jgi:hypothetical protein
MTPHFNHGQIVAILAAILICAYEPAFAQEKIPAPAPKTAAPDTIIAEPAITDTTQSARVFLDKIEVLGTIAKPQALFILPGSDPTVDGLKIDRSFFKEIFRPVEWNDFKQSGKPAPRRLPW